ncbi:hypothetical protein GCM10028805_21940 [Spirosoma harenae]
MLLKAKAPTITGQGLWLLIGMTTCDTHPTTNILNVFMLNNNIPHSGTGNISQVKAELLRSQYEWQVSL